MICVWPLGTDEEIGKALLPTLGTSKALPAPAEASAAAAVVPESPPAVEAAAAAGSVPPFCPFLSPLMKNSLFHKNHTVHSKYGKCSLI